MCTKTCTRQLETFSIDNVLVFAYLTQFLKTLCCAKMKVGVKWLHTERGTRCDSHPVKLVKGDRNYHKLLFLSFVGRNMVCHTLEN